LKPSRIPDEALTELPVELDRQVPLGCCGELYVGGNGLVRSHHPVPTQVAVRAKLLRNGHIHHHDVLTTKPRHVKRASRYAQGWGKLF
jgi:hypothetical protein